jgi:hypothetical protein
MAIDEAKLNEFMGKLVDDALLRSIDRWLASLEETKRPPRA